MSDKYDLHELDRIMRTEPAKLPVSVSGAPGIPCDRCGMPLQVMAKPNPDARLMKFSDKPEGFCASCAATSALKFYLPDNIVEMIDRNPDMLLAKHVREQFTCVMKSGQADASPTEVDWQHVVNCWTLPVNGKRRGKR